ncbi:MAG: hypothetical protein K6A40_03605 [Solobacterium sp.]|nr:hypothetical protein [Solobacterium sp.]
MPRKSQYKHKLNYNNEYNRTNYRSFSVRFNNKSEQDVIQWLEGQTGIKSYITQLIEEDMRKNQKGDKG